MAITPTQDGKINVHVRWLIRRDMPEVMEIESDSFEFPWDEEDFVRLLRQHNFIGKVAEHDNKVLGFVIYEREKKQFRVLNFAVSAGYRRRGIGQQMMADIAIKLSARPRNRIVIEVRESNLTAQLFLRKMGFRAVSVLRGFFEDTAEDAYVMMLHHEKRAQKALLPGK